MVCGIMWMQLTNWFLSCCTELRHLSWNVIVSYIRFSAFSMYSDHLHFIKFYVAAWYYNCLNSFFFSLIYTPYLIMTKWKQNFRNICKFIKNNKLKYQIYISIQTLYSVLSWSTFGSNYSLESFWVWHNKLCTPGLGDFLTFFFANPLKFSQVGWGPLVDSHFQVSPEVFDWVQVRALAGPL